MYRMTAQCHFGLEKTLNYELRKAGATDIETIDGRLTFSGDDAVLVKSNLGCSVAERIGLIIADFDAPDFDAVFEKVKQTTVSDYLSSDSAFPVVKGQSIKSKLTSIPALQRTIKKALVESMLSRFGSAPETGDVYPVRFFLFHNRMTVYLDTSGDSLHKRGYRTEGGAAPISETLAAGICDLARVRGSDIIVDPMCGSGTIAIEAAYKAMNVAPCINRSFAAEKWGFIEPSVWNKARDELRSAERRINDVFIYGSDIDRHAVLLSQKNAERAGVSANIQVQNLAVSDFQYLHGKCKVITNPPYAERLNTDEYVDKLCAELGEVMYPLNGSELYIITPTPEFERKFGHAALRNRKLYNGMIQCRLWSFGDNVQK